MKKAKTSVKIAIASALVISSTAAVIYAAPKIIEANIESGVKATVYLNIEKVDADTIKVSLDNIEDIAKSLQFSIKLDGDIKLKGNENGIRDLLVNEAETRENGGSIFTDYTYNEENNTIDVLITSEKFLPKTANKIEIFELDIISVNEENLAPEFNIVPINIDDYKYVSNTNYEYDNLDVDYSKNLISLNTAPTISYAGGENVKIFDGEVLVFDEIEEIVTEDIDGDEVTLEVRNITNINESEEDKQPIITEFSSDNIGTYTFKVYAKDSKGDKSASINILVDVTYDANIDKPKISGVEDITIQSGTVFVPLDGVTAIDARGRELTVTVSGELDLDPEYDTIYNLKYSTTDKYGNTTEVERKVTVIANKAPVITGIDNTVINIGESFNPMDGVNANDDIDGDLTSSIVISGSVNSSIPGEYKISYSVTDSGNKTTRAQRVIRVNRAPVVTGQDSTLVIKTGIEVTNEMILGGISITDETDYDIDVKLPVINGAGRYEATITVTDIDNGITKVSRNIVVSDTSIAELPESGQGTSLEDAKLIQVIDEEGIYSLNKKLSNATKEYTVSQSKKSFTDYVQYSFVISKKEAIFRDNEKIYLNVRVANSIEESTGGIVINEYTEILATDVSINNKGDLKQYIGKGDEVSLSATITPDNVTNKELEWISTNEDILEIVKSENDVKVIAKEYGVATIKVGAIDGSGKYDEITFVVNHDFEELPEDVIVVGGNGTETEPVIYSTESTISLQKLLDNAKKDYNVLLEDRLELDENITQYFIKLKQKGLIAKMLGRAKEYYISIQVPNTGEFEEILYALDINDTKAPILQYNGLTEIILENGSEFEIPIVKAYDNLDKTVTISHSIKDSNNKTIESIDTEIPGEYTISYNAADSSGNKADELIIKVVVLETEPEPEEEIPELPEEGLGPDGGVMPEVDYDGEEDLPEVPEEELLPDVDYDGEEEENKNDANDIPKTGNVGAIAMITLGGALSTLGGVILMRKKK